MASAPADIKVIRSEGMLRLTWDAEDVASYPLHALRCACRCAGCVHEMTGERLLDPQSVSQDVTVTAMELVGNYALKIVWSDGHDTGMFTWDRFRQLQRDGFPG